jgi:hypothetical protein
MIRYVRTSITIREDQLEWVRKNNALNLSGLIQDVIDDMMAMRQERQESNGGEEENGKSNRSPGGGQRRK